MADQVINLGEYERLYEAVATAQQDAVNKAAEFRAQREAIVARIKAGDTTGDALRDYALVSSLTPKKLERLRALEADFAEHEGEYVLVIEHTEELGMGCYGMGREASSRDYVRHEYLHLGVISGSNLLFDYSEYFTTVSLPCSSGGWTSNFQHTHLSELDEPREYRNVLSRRLFDVEKKLEIIVGDEAVFAWFNTEPAYGTRHYRSWFILKAAEIGRPIGADVPIS